MTAGTYSALDEKSQKLVADWVGDAVAIEAHIEEALDKQKKEYSSVAAVNQAIHHFHDSTKANRDRLRDYQEKIGKTGGKGVVEAGASVLGKAAGVVDRLRKDTLTKSLRDDYTAFNLAAISYTLLYTTALAVGDGETADLAAENLKVHAANVQRINHIISDVTVSEINGDGYPVKNNDAAAMTKKVVDAAWKETDQSGS